MDFTPSEINGRGPTAYQFIHIIASGRALSPYESAKLPLRRSGNLAIRISERGEGPKCADFRGKSSTRGLPPAIPESAHLGSRAPYGRLGTAVANPHAPYDPTPGNPRITHFPVTDIRTGQLPRRFRRCAWRNRPDRMHDMAKLRNSEFQPIGNRWGPAA